jgi:hypothetical protein
MHDLGALAVARDGQMGGWAQGEGLVNECSHFGSTSA